MIQIDARAGIDRERRRIAGERRDRRRRIDDRGGPRDARRPAAESAESARASRRARHARGTADRRTSIDRSPRRRRRASGEPAQLVGSTVRRDLRSASVPAVSARTRRALDRMPSPSSDAAFDRAAARERELGDALARVELDAAGRRVARRERVGDPAAVRHALDAELAVVARCARSAAPDRHRPAAARPPRRARCPRRLSITRPTTIAPASSRSSTGANGPGAEPVHAHRARRERALPRVHLVAALGQVRHAERALRVGLASRCAPPIASPRMPTIAPATGLPPSVTVPVDRDLPRDDDPRLVGRHRHEPHLGREQPDAGRRAGDSAPARCRR